MTVEAATAGPPKMTRLTLSLTKGLNGIFSLVLRSPWHSKLSDKFLLLSFKGRKSGKTYTLVVGYLWAGDTLEVISPRSWSKNLHGENTSVTVLLQGEWRSGIAEAFHGDETVVDGYMRSIQKSPSLIRMYRLELDNNGQPKRESVRQATRNCSLVRIQLTS